MEREPELSNSISITGGTIAKAIIIGFLFYLLFWVRDILLVVLMAIVVASAVDPAIKWFAKFKFKRIVGAILVYLAIILMLSGIIIFFIPNVLQEASSYLNKLPSDFNLGDLWSPIKESSLGTFAPNLPVKEVVDQIQTYVNGAGTGDGFFKIASAIFGGFFSFILIIVLSFYLSVQEDGVGNFLRTIVPLKNRSYVVDLWKRSQAKIGLWLQGQILLALMVGIMSYLGLAVLGIPHALLLAVLAGMFEIIPVFGPILSSIPAILIGSVEGGINGGLLVLGLYVLIQQFENHLLYPLVVRKVVGISPVLVILSLVVGWNLAGFLGFLLAIPVSAVVMEFYNDLEKRRKRTDEIMEEIR